MTLIKGMEDEIGYWSTIKSCYEAVGRGPQAQS